MPYGFTELAGSYAAPQGAQQTPGYQPDMEAPQPAPYPEPFFPENMEDEDLDGDGMPLWLRWVIFFVVAAGILFAAFFVFFKTEEKLSTNVIGKEGGEVSLPDGAKIIIPKGALESEVTFSIEKIEKKNRVTDLYHFMPDALEFQKPVTLLIPYREEKLALHEDVDDIILSVGSSPDKMQRIPTTRIESEKKLIGTEVERL